MNKGIDSYHKDKFVMGKKYWTYYMETTNKGDQLRMLTGVFSAVPSKGVSYNEMTQYFEWQIADVDRVWGESIGHNIKTYMNGYGIARCTFFETREEAIEAHDKQIAEYARRLDTRKRENMYKKMYNRSSAPAKPKEEVEAVEWLKSLEAKERKHVLWIKEYLDIQEIWKLK
jgi:hypothetical protein